MMKLYILNKYSYKFVYLLQNKYVTNTMFELHKLNNLKNICNLKII